MDDLIRRQDAIMTAVKAAIDWHRLANPQYSIAYCIGEAMRELPSAERAGRWTHVYDENEKLFFRNKWVCSACGESNTYGMSDFCPCCGAMMENSTRRMKEVE